MECDLGCHHFNRIEIKKTICHVEGADAATPPSPFLGISMEEREDHRWGIMVKGKKTKKYKTATCGFVFFASVSSTSLAIWCSNPFYLTGFVSNISKLKQKTKAFPSDPLLYWFLVLALEILPPDHLEKVDNKILLNKFTQQISSFFLCIINREWTTEICKRG